MLKVIYKEKVYYFNIIFFKQSDLEKKNSRMLNLKDSLFNSM